MRIWETGRSPAKVNMMQDEFLLAGLEKDPHPVLHLYDWVGDCATFGHFIRPEKYFHLEKVEEQGLDLEKRPTGGGVIFHMFDLTFSLAIPISHPLYSPNTLECYANVNGHVLQVICEFLGRSCQPVLLEKKLPPRDEVSKYFCMACPTKYDVILEGKVGGAAQRRSRFGFLHQGSISLRKPSYDLLEAVLKDGGQVVREMKRSGQSLLPEEASDRDFQEAKFVLRDLLKKTFVNIT